MNDKKIPWEQGKGKAKSSNLATPNQVKFVSDLLVLAERTGWLGSLSAESWLRGAGEGMAMTPQLPTGVFAGDGDPSSLSTAAASKLIDALMAARNAGWPRPRAPRRDESDDALPSGDDHDDERAVKRPAPPADEPRDWDVVDGSDGLVSRGLTRAQAEEVARNLGGAYRARRRAD